MFNKKIKVRVSFVILICLIFSTVAVWYLYNEVDSLSKLSGVLGSLLAGIIVAIVQFVIAWSDYTATEKLKGLYIIDVFFNRDKRKFYEGYISSSRKCIDIMGVTGNRLIDHFANDDVDADADSKVLLSALEKGVKVRILMPSSQYLPSQSDKIKELGVASKYRAIEEKYGGQFSVRYFDHVASHSIFIVDDECIVGPVFPGKQSKFTPALYLKNKSDFAKCYLDYFESEWQRSKGAI